MLVQHQLGNRLANSWQCTDNKYMHESHR